MKRLHSLDALRGVAALSVVVWHWQHFFALTGNFPAGWSRESQPFFGALRLFYEAGWAAVDLFFALSGFVFFWLYADAIKTGKIGAGRFALLRLSRLYPLHLAALLLVAGLQYLFWRQTGAFFIFASGDWTRFAAALLMAQQWLPPTDQQVFNGPAWSVSIEVLLYIVFFAVCRFAMMGPRRALVVALAAIWLLPFSNLIARGVMGFFLGGATYYFTAWAMARRDAGRIAAAAAVLCAAAWTLVVIASYRLPLHDLSQDSTQSFLLAFVFVVCPVTITALAMHEQRHGGRWRYLSFLGDISYSTYLLHFPLQLACALVALHFGLTPMAFMHPLVMAGFFAVLIALGAASHYGFERPAQKFLRGVMARPRPVAETV